MSWGFLLLQQPLKGLFPSVSGQDLFLLKTQTSADTQAYQPVHSLTFCGTPPTPPTNQTKGA